MANLIALYTKDNKNVYINIDQISSITEYQYGNPASVKAAVTMTNGDKIYLSSSLSALMATIGTAISSQTISISSMPTLTLPNVTVSSLPNVSVNSMPNLNVSTMPTLNVVQQ